MKNPSPGILRTLLFAAALSGGIAGAPHALADEIPDCAKPETPAIPDGPHTGKDQMLDAMKAVKNYLAASAAFRECLQKKLPADQPGKPKSRFSTVVTEMINESLDTDQLVADTFNHQLRAFKAKNQ